MIRQRTLAWTAAAALLAAAALAAAPPAGQTTAARAARGRITYRVYCANCHGPAGQGDGKIANLLKIPPPDLTRLAARNDGVFARDRILAYVDGREDVAGHGQREMPIWGLSFRPIDGSQPDESEIRGRLEDLVAFLESIQKR